MLLQLNSILGTPPNVLSETDLTFILIIPQMDFLDMSVEICLGVESAVTRECVLFKVAWRRGPGAGIAGAEVDSLAVRLHVDGLSEALPTIWALVRA